MDPQAIPLAGYDTGATISSVPIALTEWEVRPEVEDTDGSSTLTGGFHVPFPGMVKAEVHLKGWYNGVANPYSAPFNLQAGKTVSVEIFLDDTETVGWVFEEAMVKSAPNKGNIKEKVMFEAVLIGSGEFFYPSGNVL